jgi:LysR family glycine cleavage system transcriptional activator
LAWRWLAPATPGLRSTLPDVSLHPCPDRGAVDLAGADFAILPGEHLPQAGFDAAPLYDERLIPVCSPAYAARLRIGTPASLARADLIIERPDLWRLWFAHAGLMGEPDLAGPIIADPSLALEAALEGQGVALVCTLAAAPALARGGLTAPVDVSVGSGRRWWALWRRGSAGDRTAMGVLEWCLAELHAISSAHAALL